MQQADPAYLRERDVTHRYAVGRSWFLELVAAGVLPQPRRLGTRMSVWSREELDRAFADPDLPSIIAKRNERKRAQRKQAKTDEPGKKPRARRDVT
jgi:predicted DNA-binding transcriptional regulator AlpA